MAELIYKSVVKNAIRESRANNNHTGFRATYHDAECAHFLTLIESVPTTTEAEIRAKAISEFAKRVRHKIMSEIDECADELEWITEIEWQLKEE